MIVTDCQKCHNHVEAPVQLAGRTVVCERCNGFVQMPTQLPDPVADTDTPEENGTQAQQSVMDDQEHSREWLVQCIAKYMASELEIIGREAFKRLGADEQLHDQSGSDRDIIGDLFSSQLFAGEFRDDPMASPKTGPDFGQRVGSAEFPDVTQSTTAEEASR